MNQMMISDTRLASDTPARLGFLGVGWIGRHRMEMILQSGFGQAIAIADPSPEMLEEAVKLSPDAKVGTGLDDLLGENLDGIVIATPSAQHAEQSIQALEAGVAVFCQKPLGRTAAEAAAVVEAARKSDRLLGVDFSYRHTHGMRRIREIIQAGELGRIFAADLVFHNAYGPDKPWFYDRALSGGGCVMDLGVHLIDLALWSLDFPEIESVSSHLMSGGKPVHSGTDQVEDYAVATIVLRNGSVVRLACSWRLQAGCDAIISASFFGEGGGAAMTNVNGSFYDFIAERFHGTARERLSDPPDAWGGRAATAWACRLARGANYDPACEEIVRVSQVIDRIYEAGGSKG